MQHCCFVAVSVQGKYKQVVVESSVDSLVVYPLTSSNGYNKSATVSVWLHSRGYGIGSCTSRGVGQAHVNL